MSPFYDKVASCVGMGRNSATFHRLSATCSATTPQPLSLKALASKVLERNAYRNMHATLPDNGAQLSPLIEAKKLRTISELGKTGDSLPDPGHRRQITCQAFEHNGVMMSTSSYHCREWQGEYCHGCVLQIPTNTGSSNQRRRCSRTHGGAG